MKRLVMIIVTWFAVFAMPAAATAYSETPFVNAKKGETKTHRGWIVRAGDDASSFLVMVTLGCKSGHTAFLATADADVVSDDQLGKPVMITAKIIEKSARPNNHPYLKLNILRVKRIVEKETPVP